MNGERRNDSIDAKLMNSDSLLSAPPAVRSVARAEHVVHFYESDASLLDHVGAYLAEALSADGMAAAIATKVHRQGLEERLRAHGCDLRRAASAGRYLALDASETLSRILVDGWPDEARFTEVVEGLIGRASRSGDQTVRVFGEMVGVLWILGERPAAIRLEELWNGALGHLSFSLLCAYPVAGFRNGEPHALALADVASTHGRVIPSDLDLDAAVQAGPLREGSA